MQSKDSRDVFLKAYKVALIQDLKGVFEKVLKFFFLNTFSSMKLVKIFYSQHRKSLLKDFQSLKTIEDLCIHIQHIQKVSYSKIACTRSTFRESISNGGMWKVSFPTKIDRDSFPVECLSLHGRHVKSQRFLEAFYPHKYLPCHKRRLEGCLTKEYLGKMSPY